MSASESSARNRIFDLAGAEFVTIYQMIQNLQKIFGDVKVEHKPNRPED